MGGLLRNDGKVSRRLPGLRDPNILKYIECVLAFTIENMPNLKAIACLGKDAYSQVELIRKCCAGRDIEILEMLHPARKSTQSLNEDWRKLSEYFNRVPTRN
jgi:hypothetical protein